MPLPIEFRALAEKPGGYVLAALQSLIAFKPAEMKITADGRASGDQHSLLLWEMLLVTAAG